ncbi:MAG: hypothetical protein ABH852_01760 [Methanobacteriota archaeon]
MGYREDYNKARDDIAANKPVWVPNTKVVFIPPNFLVWLGADDPKLCVMDPYTTRDLAKYVVTQKIGNDISVHLAPFEEINTHRDDLVLATGKIARKIPEPCRTRFSAAMLVIS